MPEICSTLSFLDDEGVSNVSRVVDAEADDEDDAHAGNSVDGEAPVEDVASHVDLKWAVIINAPQISDPKLRKLALSARISHKVGSRNLGQVL